MGRADSALDTFTYDAGEKGKKARILRGKEFAVQVKRRVV